MFEASINQLITFVNAPENQQLLFIVGGLTLFFCLLLFILFRKKKKTNNKNPQKIVKEIQPLDEKTILQQLNTGLNKTRNLFHQHLTRVFQQKNCLKSDVIEALHEMLYRSDMGVATVEKLVSSVEQKYRDQSDVSLDVVKSHLRQKVLEITEDAANSTIDQQAKPDTPTVILVVGVNGAGKTTTIGKLATHYLAQNKSVLLCAADTFRAAATEQLKIWADRLQIKMIAHQQGADPAAVAFDGVKAAKARKYDVLLVDTAGRLQNKTNLMNELAKIKRVMGIELPGAPQEIYLVVDATTGQNAFSQVSLFKEFVNITGIIVTKLDGTAKGGVVVGLCDKFQLPIKYIGIGEKASDLRPFNAKDFATNLF